MDYNKELWLACEDGDVKNVKKYLNQGADPNWIFEGKYDRSYILYKIDYNTIPVESPSCVHIASYGGHLSSIMELLDQKDINITVTDERGLSPLLYAVIRGHHEVSDYLIMKGATLNNNDKNMILLKACGENDVDTVKEYLDQGADPSWIIKDGGVSC